MATQKKQRTDDKKTSKTGRAKKAATKDLTVREPGTVKGGVSFVGYDLKSNRKL